MGFFGALLRGIVRGMSMVGTARKCEENKLHHCFDKMWKSVVKASAALWWCVCLTVERESI